MSHLKELQQKAWQARDALAAEEARIKNERNAALVGKCFTARNNYSCPEGPQDYWPMYGKVLAAEDGDVVMFEFQRDKSGKYEIEPSVRRSSLYSGYREISEAEFRSAWLRMVEEMNAAASAAIL